MEELTPRENAPKSEQLTKEQKATMAEIERLTQDQGAALAVLAQAQAETAAACCDAADTLESILNVLVKVAKQFQVPLPAGLAEYDPDAIDQEDEDEDEDEEGDEEPAP